MEARQPCAARAFCSMSGPAGEGEGTGTALGPDEGRATERTRPSPERPGAVRPAAARAQSATAAITTGMRRKPPTASRVAEAGTTNLRLVVILVVLSPGRYRSRYRFIGSS